MKYRKNIYSDLQCVWMSSGVIEYKLCDREFDCRNCMFDKSLSNVQHKFSPRNFEDKKEKFNRIIQDIIHKIETAEFNSQYSYFRNHLVAKHLFANTYYLGFSPVAIDILDVSTSLEQCSRAEKIRKGDPMLKISGQWGQVNLTAPINLSYLGNITESFNSNERWFSLIETTKEDLAANAISVSDYHRDIIYITKQLTKFESEYPDIGVTMFDGGSEAKCLHEIIGSTGYVSILNNLFIK